MEIRVLNRIYELLGHVLVAREQLYVTIVAVLPTTGIFHVMSHYVILWFCYHFVHTSNLIYSSVISGKENQNHSCFQTFAVF